MAFKFKKNASKSRFRFTTQVLFGIMITVNFKERKEGSPHGKDSRQKK